jgi:uncharacterized SAM-binding protein YcdF (DUF218 family)
MIPGLVPVRSLRRLIGLSGLRVHPVRWVAKVAVGLVLLYGAGTVAVVYTASTRDESSGKPSQAIVVLGAAQYNGRPSPVLRARLDHALDLYRRKVAPLIVVTGGRQPGDMTTEASAAATYLLANGVPDSSIAREVQGRDTYESLAATARFLAKRNVSDVVLVTDGYHAARVKAIAGEVGLVARASPVPGSSSPFRRILRESVAVGLGSIISHRRLSSWLH